MKNHIIDAFKQSWKALVGIAAMIGIIAALQNWEFTRHEIISVFSLVGIAAIIFALIIAGRSLGVIETTLKTIDKRLGGESNPGNAGNPGRLNSWIAKGEPTTQPPPLKPTGGGAFAGMLIGGGLGSAGGPIGVIIGGVIGALIGNQIEFEQIQKRKPPQE